MEQRSASTLKIFRDLIFEAMPVQRVIWLNKVGQEFDMVLDIIGKRSKNIVVKHPGENKSFEIPRKDISEITEPLKEKEDEK
jgi:hypothetical protein